MQDPYSNLMWKDNIDPGHDVWLTRTNEGEAVPSKMAFGDCDRPENCRVAITALEIQPCVDYDELSPRQ